MPSVPIQVTSEREAIIARAKYWVSQDVVYSQSTNPLNWYQGYRRDCSGFVSMAWQLPSPLSTYTLPSVSHVISKDDLQSGDILLNQWGGWTKEGSPNAHVVIFDSWADKAHTRYNAYEESDYYGKAHYTVNMPYPYWPGYDSSDYLPMRLNRLSNPSILVTSPLNTSAFSRFVGTWGGHARSLIFNPDGHATYTGRVFRWCDFNPRPCDTSVGISGGLNESLLFTHVIGSTIYGFIASGTDDYGPGFDANGNYDPHGQLLLKVGNTIWLTLGADDMLLVSDGWKLCGPQTPPDNPYCSGA